MSTSRYGMLVFWSLEDQQFLAISPQLPGLAFTAETRLEAAARMNFAIEDAVARHQENGWPLPEPHDSRLVQEAFTALRERGLLGSEHWSPGP